MHLRRREQQVPHEGFEPSLRQESGFEPEASTSSANGAMVPVEQPRRIGKSLR